MNDSFSEFRECSRCGKIKLYTEFYKSKRDGYQTWCKSCHKKLIVSYKKIPDTYAFYYRRMGQLKRYALKAGIEFNLDTGDIQELKSIDECYYCHMDVDLVAIIRKDISIGYTKDNTVIVCDLCHKLHSRYHFNDNESKRIGKIIASFYRRTRKNKEVKKPEWRYMEDKEIIVEILKE